METIKIGKKSLAVLKSFSSLNDDMRISDKVLFAKSDTVTAIYTPGAGELKIENEFGISGVSGFLDLLSLFGDGSTLTRDGGVITISDTKKKINYLDTPLEMLDELKNKGLELFNASEDKRIRAILDEVTNKELNTIVNKMSLDKIMFKTDSEGNIKLVSSNENDNSVEFKLEGKGNPNCEYSISNSNFMGSLFPGIYLIDIRVISTPRGDKPFLQLLNKSINEDDGTLQYFIGLEES